MAETICPVVDGAKLEGHRGSMALHVAGAALTASVMGAVAAGIGQLLGAPWDEITPFAIALTAAAGVAATWGAPIPSIEGRRQVPEWWRTYFGPRPAAFLYGAALGIGFPFHLRYLTLTSVAVEVIATGDLAMGAIVLGLFGVVRSLSVAPTLRDAPAGGETADLWLNRLVLGAMSVGTIATIASA